MASRTTVTRNGFWLKLVGVVLAGLITATVLGGGGVLWSHHERLAQVETRNEDVQRRLGAIEAKVDELLALARER